MAQKRKDPESRWRIQGVWKNTREERRSERRRARGGRRERTVQRNEERKSWTGWRHNVSCGLMQHRGQKGLWESE